MKRIYETAAGKSIAAYVILNKKGEHVATVRAHFTQSRCNVEVSDKASDKLQFGTAGGYGYDKFTSALSGLTIAGYKMANHCGESAKRPKCGFFPYDYKPEKGFRTANFAHFWAATGKQVNSTHWQDLALAEWRKENGTNADQWPDGDTWETVKRNGRIMASAASERGETVQGYRSCYKTAGLEMLEAFGFKVIKAI